MDVDNRSTWQLLRQRGHLIFSGWRLLFSLLLFLVAASVVVFVLGILAGDGGTAYQAGICAMVSALLTLLISRRL